MSDLQLTPIGTSPAWYNPGEPCTGFVLEAAGTRVLVDCGSGVVSRYLATFGPEARIDAIVLGHVHPDHCFDLVPLKYGIDYGHLDWQPELWLPPGACARLERLASAWDQDFSFFTDTYTVRDYGPGDGFSVGAFSCSAVEVPHYIESFALRFEHGDSSVGYTSDTGPAPHLPAFMRDVDLLYAEAAYPTDGDLGLPDRGHITAREAGRMAADAGARSLLLTHVPGEFGPDRSRAAAAEEFDGPVALASGGERYVAAQHLAAAAR